MIKGDAMRRNLTGNNKFLKELNQKTILDLVRVNKAVSKADLSQLTGLSPTAVGMIVNKLLEKGYVHETGTGESKGGRKPMMLELKPDSFYTAGIDIDVCSMNMVLIDITSRIVYTKQVDTAPNLTAEETCTLIGVELKKILKQNAIKQEKVLGIGISVPGLIENDTQKIILAPNLGWKDIDLRRNIAISDKLPVYVENEAMASAICENWIGSCQGVNNFICINIRSGIGSGIFTEGRLYRGAGGSAGEVGHITVDENGPRCGCGNYGCLETMASVKYMEERARRLIRQGTASSMNLIEDIDRICMFDVIAAAEKGDGAAIGILQESARYLGIAISILVNTLNPTKVVLGKEFVKYSNLVMEQLQAVVAAKALKYPASKVEIAASAIGEQSSALGAAIIPLKLLFGR